MKRLGFALTIIAAVVILAGCGSMTGLKQIFGAAFSGAKLSDEIVEGFTLDEAEEIEQLSSLRTAAIAALGLPSLVADQLDAVVISIGLTGQKEQRQVVCPGPIADVCRGIPINSEVRISVRSLSDGRLVATHVNDRRP